MKAMILAAGLGTRMRPLTLTIPKPLIKVRGQALIDYHLAAFKKAQITDVVINVHHLGQQIIDYVEHYWGDDFNLHFFQEQEILGTGGGIYQALTVFDDEPFIVVSADIFTDYPYAQLPQQLKGLAHLVMVDNPAFHPEGDFYLNQSGLIDTKHGMRLTYSSIGVFHPQLFANSTQDKFGIQEVLIPAIEKGQVTGEYYQGTRIDVGTIAQLEALNLTS